MPASKPDDCERLFAQSLNRTDAEGVVELNELDAKIRRRSGELVCGTDEIREHVNGLRPIDERVGQERGNRTLSGRWYLAVCHRLARVVHPKCETPSVIRHSLRAGVMDSQQTANRFDLGLVASDADTALTYCRDTLGLAYDSSVPIYVILPAGAVVCRGLAHGEGRRP